MSAAPTFRTYSERPRYAGEFSPNFLGFSTHDNLWFIWHVVVLSIAFLISSQNLCRTDDVKGDTLKIDTTSSMYMRFRSFKFLRSKFPSGGPYGSLSSSSCT